MSERRRYISYSVALPPELYKLLRKYAASHETSVSAVIREAVTEYLSSRRMEPPVAAEKGRLGREDEPVAPLRG